MKLQSLKFWSNRPFRMALSLALVFTLLVSALPQSSASAVTCKYKHKVLQGETLMYIADLYGVSWQKIADASDLTAPYTITAGMKLCIPEGEKPPEVETEDLAKGATLQVVPGINKLLVSVENFHKKTSYFVQIYRADESVSYKIGHFTTNKEGDFTGWFRVPYGVFRSPRMTVCVKNAWTDATYCIRYNDTYANIPMLNGYCPPKEGR